MEASASTPQRRLTVGGVIDKAFKLYAAHFGVLILAAAAIFIIAGLIQGLLTEVDSFILQLGGSLVSLVAGTLFTGFVVSLVADVREGRTEFTAGELLSSGWHAVPRLIINGILLGIAVIIGLFLLIIPGLYLLTIWAVTAPSIVVERRGAIEAFGRSHELVKGDAWTVFGAIVVAFLILLGFGLIAGAIGAAIGNLAGAIIFSVVANIIAAPFAALVASVLFFDLRGSAPAADAPPPAPAPAA